MEQLYIYERKYVRPHWQHVIENAQWLELLRPFTAVKNLYLRKEFAPRIPAFMQELVGGRVTEVSPVLENHFLEGVSAVGTYRGRY